MTDGIDSMHNALSLPLICGFESAFTESVGEMVSEGFYVNEKGFEIQFHPGPSPTLYALETGSVEIFLKAIVGAKPLVRSQ